MSEEKRKGFIITSYLPETKETDFLVKINKQNQPSILYALKTINSDSIISEKYDYPNKSGHDMVSLSLNFSKKSDNVNNQSVIKKTLNTITKKTTPANYREKYSIMKTINTTIRNFKIPGITIPSRAY